MRASLVSAVREAMVLTGRSKRLPRHPDTPFLKIHSGAYIRSDYMRSLRTPWDRRNASAVARSIAALHVRPGARPFARTAALLLGFSLLAEDPSIHLHFGATGPVSGRPTTFAPLILDSTFFAPATTCVHHRGALLIPSDTPFAHPDRDQLIALVLQCVLDNPGEESFAIACQGLNRLAEVSRGRDSDWRGRERLARSELLAALDNLPAGTRNLRRARWIVERACAGCESVGEIRLLWALRSEGILGLVTQFGVIDPYVRFFIDLAIPELKIAIEFDGRGKYGVSAQEQIDALNAQEARQRELEIRGWAVIRVGWADLADPSALAGKVEALIRARGGSSRRGAHFPRSAQG